MKKSRGFQGWAQLKESEAARCELAAELEKLKREVRLVAFNLQAPEGADLAHVAYRLVKERDNLMKTLMLLGDLSGGMAEGQRQTLCRLA